MPERGVFGTRQTRSGQEQYAWSQPTTLQVSQERPARACVLWQELAPPGGELTAQDERGDCHTMAPRAMTHSLSVRPPSPLLPSSLGPGAIIVLRKRDRLAVYAARIRVSFSRGRLERNVVHAGKNGSLCNAGEKAWIRSWLRRSMWLWPGHCLISTTIASQTRPGSGSVWLLSQQTPRTSMVLPEQACMGQM